MAEHRAEWNWKRTCRLGLKVYAVLCTTLVTAGVALWLWSVLFPNSPGASGNSQEVFLTAHDAYMAAEYPLRGARFRSMVEALCEYVAATPIPEPELFKYLGRPDEYYLTNIVVRAPRETPTTNRVVLFSYLFDRPGRSRNESVTAQVADGKVYQVTLYDYKHKGLRFQPYPAPDQHAGANGWPPSLDTNRTSAAAASRRSP